ncbi:enoyl-CoA hydratase/isomerase family protein [Hyphobacterium sp. HN65]|uniref:3-hydroxyisobutyryl-CoA hydrolase n=1 Tax=Hyphobacterium lacteum TaxID=3116575 RepID=A0ABU7LMB4_9PROT|nr:enoyl-CoA hydratase/isomerase family protein [Hyphobacterium sp. HN65]MEE2525032.1 enoyl-CoA hydratase/isomerase family protein [Hyphobacterium sp. HN65]
MTDEIIARKVGQLGRITLNRPKALNALTLPMVHAMTEALMSWKDDAGVQAIVVDAEGEKGFCAGGDILMLHNSGKAGGEDAWRFWHDEYQLNTLIQEYPKPYVALIDGITMGGGVGISVHGSHRVAGDRTMFAMPETGIGFHPDVGGAYFLPRLPGEIGMWMGLTGARLKAADCLAAGLATHYCPSADQASLLDALEKADLASDEDKLEEILEAHSGDPGSSELALVRGLIDAAFEGDDVPAMMARMEAAGDQWSAKQLKIMGTKSPTAMVLTAKCLRRGADLSFEDVMRQDLRVSMRCLAGTDFYEGVRAVIIDKDNAPSWSPAAIGKVDAEALEAYFEPLAADKEQTFLGE